MIRRALIIYCNDTESGKLDGPVADNINIRNYLKSSIGGEWKDDEIYSLNNPLIIQVHTAIKKFLNGADYTIVVFSGHGYINENENYTQYMEILDCDVSLNELVSTAKRQTIIVDSCRGFMSPLNESLSKGLSRTVTFSKSNTSTRDLFNQAVLSAEEGITVLFAASENQSASDSDKGGAYLYSLLLMCRDWGMRDEKHNILPLDVAHKIAIPYMKKNFITIQNPVISQEKRLRYFPLAVKYN